MLSDVDENVLGVGESNSYVTDNPVSYTHLDVYKRQTWNFEPIDGTARMYFNAADAIEGFDSTTEDVLAVSYTHLDVYKRQRRHSRRTHPRSRRNPQTCLLDTARCV